MARYAAIDIGSNSLRMEAAEVTASGAPKILASERQVTRLGASVFRGGRISQDAIENVCAILTSMAAMYKRLEVSAVRAVATAAVRDASNQDEFVARTSAALGVKVEIISGQEEARLIQLGVRSRWPHPRASFLIIDIGGGSAEIILSENERIAQTFSKPLGALRLQEMFLRGDPPREAELHRMHEFIEEKIGSAVRRLDDAPISRVIGTSATAAAVVCAANEIERVDREESDRQRATTPQIRRLYRELSVMTTAERQKVTGIGPRRAEIIIPGTAVLLRLLEAFRKPALFYSAAGVRDGIIADLAQRGTGVNLCELAADQRSVVEDLAEHYGVTLRHARRVAKLAGDLFLGLQKLHRLAPQYGGLLEAAAYLHDSGHYVSDTRHHKHSYYLVTNSDMPGFTAVGARTDRQPLPLSPEVAARCRNTPNLHLLDTEGAAPSPFDSSAANGRRSGPQPGTTRPLGGLQSAGQRISADAEYAAGNDIDLEVWAAERLSEIFARLTGSRPLIAI